MFRAIQAFCEQNAAAEVARAFESEDAEALREFASGFDQWLDQFATNLPRTDTKQKSTDGHS